MNKKTMAIKVLKGTAATLAVIGGVILIDTGANFNIISSTLGFNVMSRIIYVGAGVATLYFSPAIFKKGMSK